MIARAGSPQRGWISIALPGLLVLGLVLFLLAILIVVRHVPVGPMYWDLYIYFDAVQRLRTGQIPAVDFFMPAGPLFYWIFDWALRLLPKAQPLLLISWSVLLITGPAMVIACTAAARRSLIESLLYLLPFLVFTALPFNTQEFYPFPGSDGFGIYNRHGAQLLYVLVVTVLALRHTLLMAVMIALLMLALFLTKITAFAAGGLICLFALATLRIPFRHALVSAAIFLIALTVLELVYRLPSAYIFDVLTLVSMNEGSLLPRYLQGASINIVPLLGGGILALLTLRWPAGGEIPPDGARWMQWHERIAALLDRIGLWVLVTLLATLIYETQNTGSQAMIAAIPPALLACQRIAWQQGPSIGNITRVAMAALLVMPLAGAVTEKAARTWIGAIKNEPIAAANLKTVGSVTARPFFIRQAEVHLKVALQHQETFETFIQEGELPSPLRYSDFEFQIRLIWTMDALVRQLQQIESRRGVRFDTIMTLDFTNPIPWVMGRSAPKHIAIGADPTRTVPEPDEEAVKAVAETDLALLPTCAPRANTAHLLRIYGPALQKHRRMRLTPCYDGFVHPRLAGSLAPGADRSANTEEARPQSETGSPETQ
ncbi:hypothetical protein [Notoacmeibacter sp. MSK16QG-6]|uniref:hypothetical protein n=1 Tax=Notoacmeibacter sp. MSK16QG-6 TaxID=2957982 RepID=UPI0020A15B8D|nr:hypothetical protein [Notoacmeibacter sp. MSK16QG-6]MCP1199614.1 hypothetical protein [Notoacmeibacter sp. MSK16QG-6]